MLEWVVDRPGLRLGLGDSVNYTGDADLVFTHPYGPLPSQLIGKPAIINLVGDKKAIAEQWCGAELHEVSKWGTGLTNTIYVAHLPVPPMNLSSIVEDEFKPGRGWFPDKLCDVMLNYAAYVHHIKTVFDGFMGRGTVGKACQQLGFAFVGIDRDPQRVNIARDYLGC